MGPANLKIGDHVYPLYGIDSKHPLFSFRYNNRYFSIIVNCKYNSLYGCFDKYYDGMNNLLKNYRIRLSRVSNSEYVDLNNSIYFNHLDHTDDNNNYQNAQADILFSSSSPLQDGTSTNIINAYNNGEDIAVEFILKS